MAREHAAIRLAIWSDDDFRKLSPAAQHLYFVLLTEPTLSYCGVADWRPGRIAKKAAGWTAGAVRVAAAELATGLFIVIDEDSEEVLVRSFVKHDGLLKHPKVSVSMAKAFAAVASPTLRGVVVHQLRLLHERQPDLKAWSVDAVTALLARDAVDPTSLDAGHFDIDLPIDQPNGLPIAQPSGFGTGYPMAVPNGLGEPEPNGLGIGFLPAPAPAPSSSSIEGGYVGRERHLSIEPDRDDPPPTSCPDHPDGTSAPCGACRSARLAAEAREAGHAQRAAEARRSEQDAVAAAVRAEIDDCPMCDDTGYDNGRVCHHDPDAADRAAAGIAAARAAINRRGDA